MSEGNKNTEYTLYLDMDGVLVNFDGGFVKIANGMTLKQYADVYGDPASREKFLKAGVDWWANLDWIQGGKEIWDTANRLFSNVQILSSAGSTDPIKSEMVIQGKREWLSKHLPSLPKESIHIVLGKHRKQEYASKDTILVDDVPATIKEWIAKGGFGILHSHKSYKKSIEQMEEIAKPIRLSEIAKRYL